MAVAGDYKRLVIDTATSGDNELVAAVDGKEIRVISFELISTGTVITQFKSGAATAISGAYPLVANTGLVNPGNSIEGAHPFETAAGEALVLNLSAAIQVDGDLVYVLGTD